MSRTDRWLTLVLLALTVANLYLTCSNFWTRTKYRELIAQQAVVSDHSGAKLDALLAHLGIPDPTTRPSSRPVPHPARP